MNPPPKGRVVQVTILRDKSGFKNKLYPKYHVFFSEDINKHLMSVKKKAGGKGTNYSISLDKKDFSKKSSFSLGKLKSNFVGTNFYLYDNGVNPKNRNCNTLNVRQEYCHINYQKNIMGMKGPRKLRVTVPDYKNGKIVEFKPQKQEFGLCQASKIANAQVRCFMNNPPQWSDEYEAFVLDFYNRVEQASVKNFQLIEIGDGTQGVCLQFGKIDKNIYNLDYKYPFSLF